MRPLSGRCARRTIGVFVILEEDCLERRFDDSRRLCRNVTETQPGLNVASSGFFSVRKWSGFS